MRIEEMIRNGVPGASAVPNLLRNLDDYLSATQLGITLASLGLGWIGEPAFARLLEPWLNDMGIFGQQVHTVAVAIGFSVITILHVVVGELSTLIYLYPLDLSVDHAQCSDALLFARFHGRLRGV